LGAAVAGAGAVEIVGVAAGVVAAGALGVAGAGVVGVSAGGAKTAAPAVLGRAMASTVSRHRADLDTDAWMIEIERIGLWGLASIAPRAFAGKRLGLLGTARAGARRRMARDAT
jgi:hypothetical protein